MADNKGLEIEFRPDLVHETYSNLALITHSQSEFMVDFAQMGPGLPKAQVRSRIIMTPDHAKRLLAALGENIEKYEAQFGEIRLQNSTFIPPVGGGQIN